jgi:CRP-like cAMP-binding protein
VAENRLLATLATREHTRLLGLCDRVHLPFGTVLGTRGQPTRQVYFPHDCFISLVTAIEDEPGLEVGMVGNEGMLGAQLVLGVGRGLFDASVQGAGTASCMQAAAFRRELARSEPLRRAIHHYVYVLMAQFATSAACTRFHNVGPRLARCLLMSQDRAHSDSFHLTHEFLASMLGVRRVGITRAAGDLQRSALIRYHRGEITVLDRAGLEEAACGCYKADRRAYERTMA